MEQDGELEVFLQQKEKKAPKQYKRKQFTP